MTWRACGIRSCAAGFCTTGASTNPSCTQSSVISTTFWFVGPCGNTSGSAGTIDAPHIGSLRWQVGSRGCLPTGIYWANGRAAGCWEPYKRRRSRTVLRAPGGETPSGDSPGDPGRRTSPAGLASEGGGKRLREELAKLQVEVNEEKSRRVDLQQGESFGFLGFEFRRIRSRRGRWMPLYTPRAKKRTALLRQLKLIFRSFRSQPVQGLIAQINPILRGWVNYFAAGHSSRCFSYLRSWVEQKIRRHLARAGQRQGLGWKRWHREWPYDTLGLFDGYRVVYPSPSWAAVVPRVDS